MEEPLVTPTTSPLAFAGCPLVPSRCRAGGDRGLSPSPVLCGPPPEVTNAFVVGKKKEKYSIHSSVRYQCHEGFTQRHVPTIKCHVTGKWDRPKILCTKR